MATFNGETLVITLDSGVTDISVQDDLYEAWKDWMLASPLNRKYPPAFRTIGGDPLSPVINAGAYFFLQNDLGWRIKPPEEDITIYLSGNLAAEDSSIDMFIPTTGTFTTALIGLQPVTQIAGGGATAAEVADAVWDEQLSEHTTTGSTGKQLQDIPTEQIFVI